MIIEDIAAVMCSGFKHASTNAMEHFDFPLNKISVCRIVASVMAVSREHSMSASIGAVEFVAGF